MNVKTELCNAFNHQAPHYEQAAIIQNEIGERLFERLSYLTIKPRYVLDLGCGTGVFLKQLKDSGFSGVQNFPTVGLIDGVFRANLEETGMGYDLEVEMIKQAHELDLLTTPYVFDEEQAVKMAKAGADILVAHMGLTTKGTIGAKTALTLDDCVKKVQAICDAGKSVNPDILVICHGGPIAEPADAQYVLSKTTGVAGFFGASSIERFATEVGIKQQAEAFKNINI